MIRNVTSPSAFVLAVWVIAGFDGEETVTEASFIGLPAESRTMNPNCLDESTSTSKSTPFCESIFACSSSVSLFASARSCSDALPVSAPSGVSAAFISDANDVLPFSSAV